MDFIENLRDVDWDRVLLQGSETLRTLQLWYQSDLDRLLWRSGAPSNLKVSTKIFIIIEM